MQLMPHLPLLASTAFELAERKRGKALEDRMDSESNQAMFEIAETFMDSDDYDNAIKFFDRLWRLEQLGDSDRSTVRFKQGPSTLSKGQRKSDARKRG